MSPEGTYLAELLDGCRILEAEGLTTAYGDLSLRTAALDEAVISASEGPGLVRGERDLIRVGLDGTVREGSPDRVAGAAAIHLGLLKAREEISSVCRFYGPACLAWGTLGRPLPAVTGMGMFVGHEVPCFESSTTIQDLDGAAELAECLGDGPAVIMRGFGAVTVGTSPAQAVVRAWLMEQNAKAALAASAVGEPLSYGPEEAAELTRNSGPAASQIARAFYHLRQRAKGAM